MTRVCLLGAPDVNLQYELLSRETSREALSTYDLERPFENSIAVRTVSVGAAVSLCNDLQWYIVRFVDEVLIHEPSVSETEWLSRRLAEAIRNEAIEPAETGEFLKVYGVEPAPEPDADPTSDGTQPPNPTGERPMSAETDERRIQSGDAPGEDALDEAEPAPSERTGQPAGPPRLVEPLFVRRDRDADGKAGADGGNAAAASDGADGTDGDRTDAASERGEGTAEEATADDGIPEYDLRPVEETLVVRLTEDEYAP